MPTQKIFKQRVRARMTKTGEAYTAARRQLLRKGADPAEPESLESLAETVPPAESATAPTEVEASGDLTDSYGTSDDAMLRASGKRHAEWFSVLDAWGATDRGHTEIARWLSETHGVPGWWTQSITVAYERARGMRARHQMPDGFRITATRTVAVGAERALAAFTNSSLLGRWLPDASMQQRPTRAALTARFDWSDPRSRVVVTVVPRGPHKALVSISHEQLPDAESGERLKHAWRESLGMLKNVLEES